MGLAPPRTPLSATTAFPTLSATHGLFNRPQGLGEVICLLSVALLPSPAFTGAAQQHEDKETHPGTPSRLNPSTPQLPTQAAVPRHTGIVPHSSCTHASRDGRWKSEVCNKPGIEQRKGRLIIPGGTHILTGPPPESQGRRWNSNGTPENPETPQFPGFPS